MICFGRLTLQADGLLLGRAPGATAPGRMLDHPADGTLLLGVTVLNPPTCNRLRPQTVALLAAD
jgi:hypothetical protein